MGGRGAQGGQSPACPFTLACFSAPLPRRGRISPRPALAERSSPPGKGETKGYFMQGASPLASPGLNPGGTGFSCGKRVPAGGFAPCGAGWGWRCGARRGAQGGGRLPTLPCRNPAGALAFLVACLPFYFSFNSAPIPPTRARRALFPSGEGGDLKFSYARGFAPCIPGAESTVRRENGRKRFPMSSAGSQGEGGPGERNFGV